jgi:branched-subunit amino acid transport protein
LIWSCCWPKLAGDTKIEEKKIATTLSQKKKKVLGGSPATPWVAGVAARHLTWLTATLGVVLTLGFQFFFFLRLFNI